MLWLEVLRSVKLFAIWLTKHMWLIQHKTMQAGPTTILEGASDSPRCCVGMCDWETNAALLSPSQRHAAAGWFEPRF